MDVACLVCFWAGAAARASCNDACLRDMRTLYEDGVQCSWVEQESYTRHCLLMTGVQLKTAVCKKPHLAEDALAYVSLLQELPFGL